MAKIDKKISTPVVDKKTHMGYNEKNPVQPEAAFKADSMETNPLPVKKTVKKNSV